MSTTRATQRLHRTVMIIWAGVMKRSLWRASRIQRRPLVRRVPRLRSGRLRLHGFVGALSEYDGSDNLLRKFIYGPGIDEPICMTDVVDSNAIYYYHFDGLGSVAALSDVNNVIVESYSYDVFGAPTIYYTNRKGRLSRTPLTS